MHYVELFTGSPDCVKYKTYSHAKYETSWRDTKSPAKGHCVPRDTVWAPLVYTLEASVEKSLLMVWASFSLSYIFSRLLERLGIALLFPEKSWQEYFWASSTILGFWSHFLGLSHWVCWHLISISWSFLPLLPGIVGAWDNNSSWLYMFFL